MPTMPTDPTAAARADQARVTTDSAQRQQLEHQRIDQRRAHWGLPPVSTAAPVTGLALSGGGIRSATLSLGLVQALASRTGEGAPLLPRLDYLSTVSGGGYTGSFLGSLFLPRRYPALDVPDGDRAQDTPETARAAAERVLALLADPAHLTDATITPPAAANPDAQHIFHPLRWLRENGRYLTPSGARDGFFMAAFYLRALFGVHYVLLLMLLACMLAVYAARLLLHGVGVALDWGVPGPLDAFSWGRLLGARSLDLWWSPLLLLAPVVVLGASGPLILAYWSVYRQDQRDRRSLAELLIEYGPAIMALAAMGAVALLLWAGMRFNWLIGLLAYGWFLGVAATALRSLWLDWVMSKEVVPAGNEPVPPWRLVSGVVAKARLRLNQALAASLRAALLLLAVALIDSLAQTLFVAVARGRPAELFTLGTSGGLMALLLLAARKLGTLAGANRFSALLQQFAKPIVLVVALLVLAALAALAGLLLQAVLWSGDIAQAATNLPSWLPRSSDWHAGLLAGLLVALLLLGWLTRSALGFLNNSTFHRFYSARLVRTFLGAANFQRLRDFRQALVERATDGKALARLFVSETHPHDDVSLRSYYGNDSAAPLHLINVNLNERLSQTSALVRDDRKGVPLAVGPAGLQVDQSFFAWSAGARGSAIADAPQAAAECERLPLGSWVAISGAAVSTGLGRLSSTGFSLLTWLVNARLAYWWRPAPAMSSQQRRSFWRTFDLVWQEMTGRFYGQRGLLWNLSDGGHFENTAAYELVRRRAALIVCADNGGDPHYDFNDLQNLVRRVRVDFGAEIELMTDAAAKQLIGTYCTGVTGEHRLFGTLEDFKDAARRPHCCALLATVHYAPVDDEPARRGLLLLVKPTVLAAAPADVQLYARDEPDFPQQSTGDQFFDEAQWESYRKLGQSAGRQLAPYWPGLLAAGLELSADTYRL